LTSIAMASAIQQKFDPLPPVSARSHNMREEISASEALEARETLNTESPCVDKQWGVLNSKCTNVIRNVENERKKERLGG